MRGRFAGGAVKGHRRVLAVDPGPETCGVVILRLTPGWPPEVLLSEDRRATFDVLCEIESLCYPDRVAVEWLTSYGSCVGASVLETARVVGRIEQQAIRTMGLECYVHGLTRPEINLELVGIRGAKGAQVKEACRQIYRDGGVLAGSGVDRTKGLKGDPGPLYAVRGDHAWSALAVGLAAWRKFFT